MLLPLSSKGWGELDEAKERGRISGVGERGWGQWVNGGVTLRQEYTGRKAGYMGQ